MTSTHTLLAAVTLAFAAGGALADSHDMAGMDHSAMGGDGMAGQMEDAPAHMRSFTEAMDAMMGATPTESSGMMDADFLLMMIPHHQSAVDMARVEVEQGGDEETKTLAQRIIDSQEAEIAEMRAMLERMGVEAPAGE